MQFERDTNIEHGILDSVAPKLRRIVANNPSPFTFTGTNTYVVGHGDVAVIDPGPLDSVHIDALLNSLGNEKITHILLTHTHSDHSSACELLQKATTAPVYSYRLSGLELDTIIDDTNESADLGFEPDESLADGQIIKGKNWTLECVFTPGHMLNHMCFALAEDSLLISGDHVMAWSTSIVSPPEGHMGSYMSSLEKLLERNDNCYWPGHGGPVNNPREYVKALINHRIARENKVIECVIGGMDTIESMISFVYSDVDEALYPAARRSLYATVIHLVETERLKTEAGLHIESRLALI